jgi:hypothetical protein
VWLIVLGVFEVVSAFGMRKAATSGHTPSAPTEPSAPAESPAS